MWLPIIICSLFMQPFAQEGEVIVTGSRRDELSADRIASLGSSPSLGSSSNLIRDPYPCSQCLASSPNSLSSDLNSRGPGT